MFENKKANIILSLLIAVTLWCYVVYQVNPTQRETIENIPVHFENEDTLNERGLAVADSRIATISIVCEGSRKEMSGIDADDFYAYADVSECIKGDNILEVSLKMSKDVTRTSNATITVHVQVEEVVTELKQVQASYDGVLDDNLVLEIDSQTDIEVTGAKSLVDSVSYIKAEIDKNKTLKNGDEVTAELTAVNEKGAEVSNVSLSASEAVIKVLEKSLKSVRLNVNVTGEVSSLYEFEGIDAPDKITIYGSEEDIKGIESLNAQAIDISAISEDTEVDLKIDLPEGVSISAEELPLKATVKVKEKEAEEVSFNSSEIDLLNVEEGMKAVLVSKTVKIYVVGSDDISKDDFILSCNLKGKQKGEYDVELDVKYTGDGKISSMPESVKVKILGE